MTKSDSDVEVLKQAYIEAAKSNSGQHDTVPLAWVILSKAFAKCFVHWPLDSMSIEDIGKRINRIASEAGFSADSITNVNGDLTGIARIKNSPSSFVIQMTIDNPIVNQDTALIFFHRESTGMIASILRLDSGYLLPHDAVNTGDGVLIVSLDDWQTTFPSPVVSYYRKEGNQWACMSQEASRFQLISIPEIRSVQGKNHEFACTTGGRTYPKNISVAHVNAHVEMRVRFFFNGQYIHKREWRVSNAMAVLDDLIGAIGRNDRKTVSALCLRSKDVAKLMNYKRVAKSDPTASNISSVCTVDDHVFELPAMRYRFYFAKVGGNWKLARLKQISGEDD